MENSQIAATKNVIGILEKAVNDLKEFQKEALNLGYVIKIGEHCFGKIGERGMMQVDFNLIPQTYSLSLANQMCKIPCYNADKTVETIPTKQRAFDWVKDEIENKTTIIEALKASL